MRFLNQYTLILLNLVPVLLNMDPVGPPYWANTTVEHGQNSVKNSARQCQTVPTASQEYGVTSKRPKNNDGIPAYPGS